MEEEYVQRSPFPCRDYPSIDLYRLIQPSFQKYGNRTALTQSSGGLSYTFTEIENDVERVAYHMDQLGVRQGDIVGFYAQNSVEWSVVMLATWRLGAIFAAFNKLLTSYEMQSLVKIVNPTYMFTDSTCADKLFDVIDGSITVKAVMCRESRAGCVSFADLTRPIPAGCQAPPIPDININDAACILLSSGTTGLPKAVQLSHKTCVFQITVFLEPPFQIFTDYQTIYMPLAHIYGVMMVTCGLFSGYTGIVMEQFNLQQFLESVQKYKTIRLHLVPPLVVLLAKHPLVSKYDLSHVEEIFCAAAPLGEEATLELKKRLGMDLHFLQEANGKSPDGYLYFHRFLAQFSENPPSIIYQRGRLNEQDYGVVPLDCFCRAWGMTEVCGVTTLCPVRKSSIVLSHKSVGIPIMGSEVKVIDLKNGKNLGPDQTGEICIRGPHVMIGYVNNPAATANILDTNGWIHTGDIGYYDKTGAFFVIDRLKELIKYKAYQVAPAELEDLLLSHPLVADSAVIGIPDKEGGEVPLAWVVKKAGAEVTEKDIQDFVAGKVAPYKKLRGGVTFVDSIPKSASGKILRKDIRAAVKKSSK